MCHVTAPNLVQVYSKYRERDVDFVSLSMNEESVVRSFVDAAGISWPSGFGVSPVTMRRLGVFTTEFAETFPEWGGEVMPALYVLRGRAVVWCDGQMRFRHAARTDIQRALEQALDEALGGS